MNHWNTDHGELKFVAAVLTIYAVAFGLAFLYHILWGATQ